MSPALDLQDPTILNGKINEHEIQGSALTIASAHTKVPLPSGGQDSWGILVATEG